jgi:uncharacterized protein (UPF0248 family)
VKKCKWWIKEIMNRLKWEYSENTKAFETIEAFDIYIYILKI